MICGGGVGGEKHLPDLLDERKRLVAQLESLDRAIAERNEQLEALMQDLAPRGQQTQHHGAQTPTTTTNTNRTDRSGSEGDDGSSMLFGSNASPSDTVGDGAQAASAPSQAAVPFRDRMKIAEHAAFGGASVADDAAASGHQMQSNPLAGTQMNE